MSIVLQMFPRNTDICRQKVTFKNINYLDLRQNSPTNTAIVHMDPIKICVTSFHTDFPPDSLTLCLVPVPPT